MEIRTHGSDLHVVQQSRRDKLRVQNIPISPQYLGGDFAGNNSEHYWSNNLHNQGPNMDLAQLPSCRYGNHVSYDHSMLSSELLNVAPNSQSLVVAHNRNDAHTMNNQESTSPRCDKHVVTRGNNALCTNLSRPNISDFVSVGGDPQHCGTWKIIGDWSNVVSYLSGDNDKSIISPTNVGESSTNCSLMPNSVSSSTFDVKPSYLRYHHELQSSLNNLSGEINVVGQYSHKNVMPFGPFTGYATILKNSRFLKPAQQLLYELCNFPGHRGITVTEFTKKVLDEVKLSCDAFVNEDTCLGGPTAGDSSGLSSAFYQPNETSRDAGFVSSSNGSHPRSEFQQTKVKLLYMLDEVCRRYRQYHLQMQMVVSSFESVVGLSGATPYILLALKAISRNFYSLNSTISYQLRNIQRTLGEELLSPNGRDSSSLKLVQDAAEKHEAIGSRIGILDHQPHLWRPQRGLPEGAVAVLRAWLFDHFLHPYPTDADKHMLATQTGLTRNQVSNWFINARVRVWKPMVEEIHMLEMKAMAEKGSNIRNAQVTIATESATQRNHLNRFSLPNEGQYLNRLSIPAVQAEFSPGIGKRPHPVANWSAAQQKQSRINDCDLPMGAVQAEFSPGIGERPHPVANWSAAQQKQSRINGCDLPTGMDGPTMMGFVPYQRNNLEIGSLGSVSLTLGLRQSAEQYEPQLRQQLGGQIIHDYFG